MLRQKAAFFIWGKLGYNKPEFTPNLKCLSGIRLNPRLMLMVPWINELRDGVADRTDERRSRRRQQHVSKRKHQR